MDDVDVWLGPGSPRPCCPWSPWRPFPHSWSGRSEARIFLAWWAISC